MSTGSYWCYRCSRFVRVSNRDAVTCPDCQSGFVEEIEEPPRGVHADSHRHRRGSRRFPAAAMYMIGGGGGAESTNSANDDNPDGSSSDSNRSAVLRRTRRNGGDRSPFNPVIVMRGGASSGPSDEFGGGGPTGDRGFQLYYAEGGGSRLRPLPPSMSEFLLGPGFDRLLDQISQIEINNIGNNNSRCEHPPASKAAIDSLPAIEIDATHLETESQSHCAVCKEAFTLGTGAREMPCKHIYHSDCILPWLALRNSCPVCRHQLPPDDDGDGTPEERGAVRSEEDEDEAAGLTIWRLPGGGFAVGRFAGGRRGGVGGEREMPVVYTEMDGAFSNGGLPRRISWGSRGSRGRERGGSAGQFFRNLFSCFRGVGSSSRSGSRVSRSRSHSLFNSSSSRRRAWVSEVDSGGRSLSVL